MSDKDEILQIKLIKPFKYFINQNEIIADFVSLKAPSYSNKALIWKIRKSYPTHVEFHLDTERTRVRDPPPPPNKGR